MSGTRYVAAKDLRLGDVVRLHPTSPFMDAIVRKVETDKVTFWRPYGSVGGVPYGDPPRLICLHGAEEFTVERDEFAHRLVHRDRAYD